MMEYIPGITFEELKFSTLSPQEAKQILQQVLEGVKYCLIKKICPLDFHEENLIISSDYELTFIDFGKYLEFPEFLLLDMGHKVRNVLHNLLDWVEPLKRDSEYEKWSHMFYTYYRLDQPEEFIK